MNITPITPDQVAEEKRTIIPDEVIAAFNELIAKNYRSGDGSAAVKQKDVVFLAIEKTGHTRPAFDLDWLEVEDIYRGAGWNVEYDRPGYNETYDAVFIFTKKNR